MSGPVEAWARRLLTIGSAVLVALLVTVGAAGAAAPSVVRVGQAPREPAGAQVEGVLPADSRLQLVVALKPRDPAALAAYATAVATPGSSVYHQYLTVAQFRRRFGPTDQQIAAVESALRAQGLDPGTVPADGLSIPMTVSAGTASTAFGTSFHHVKLRSGRIAYANAQAPQLTASVAGVIQGVVGLDDLAQEQPLGLRPARLRAGAARLSPHIVTGGPQPCSAASSTASEYGGYTADQLASAYSFSSLYGAGDEGAGQTVAIFELEPDLTSDISAYQSCYGTSATVTYSKEDGGAGNGAGSGEAALDIEDVIGLAPKATLDVYQAPNSNTGLLDDYTAIVDNTAAHVVTTSWGECESEEGSTLTEEESTLFEQAATEGQSIMAAAGDDGSSACGTSSLAVGDPGSQPFVTSVGGTSLTALGPPPTQTVWNDSDIEDGAGGGGVSSSWKMPAYQSGAPSSLNVINAHSSGSPCKAASGSYCREVPDVSADADPETGCCRDRLCRGHPRTCDQRRWREYSGCELALACLAYRCSGDRGWRVGGDRGSRALGG